MDLKVLCPSKGRAGNVLTLQAFPDLTFVVTEEEAGLYKEHYPDNEVLATPQSIKGITATKQWIFDHFRDRNIFMVDDDIYMVRRFYSAPGDEISITDPVMVYEVVRETAYIAKAIGAKMFGFTNARHPATFKSHQLITHTGYVNSSHFGVIAGHNLNYDLRISDAEDYFLSAYNIFLNRYLVLDQRFAFFTKDNFTGQGGANDYRTTQTMMADTLLLRKLFGSVVVPKGTTLFRKNTNRGERSLSFPF